MTSSGFQFGEETPGFLSSINPTNLHSHHPPELVAGTESQGPPQKLSSGEFFQKEVLCIVSLTAVWITLSAWWTRQFLSCDAIKILPCLNDATGRGERAHYICQCRQFQESMANERGRFWNIRYGFLWPL